jgi:hypothetical protein
VPENGFVFGNILLNTGKSICEEKDKNFGDVKMKKIFCSNCKNCIIQFFDGAPGFKARTHYGCLLKECPKKIDFIRNMLVYDESYMHSINYEIFMKKERKGSWFKQWWHPEFIKYLYQRCDKINQDGQCKLFEQGIPTTWPIHW